MAITFTYKIDALDLEEAMDDGQTHLRLWSSNTIEGPYTYTNEEEALVAATYEYTFTYGSGNRAMYYKVLFWDGSAYSAIAEAPPVHGGGGTTLATIRRRLGQLTGDLEYGTTTGAGSTTSAVCTSIDLSQFGDDYFNGWKFHNVDNNEASLITDWVQSTGTFTLSPAITSVGSGVDFEVCKRWTPRLYREAINWAVGYAYPKLSRPIVNTSLRTADGELAYEVPHDIRLVNKVEIEDILSNPDSTDRNVKGHPWREVPYGTIPDGITQTIEFKYQLPYEDGVRRIRIRGTGVLSQVYNDSDYIELVEPQTDLILYLAAHYLYNRLVGQSAALDRDYYQEMAKFYLSMYENAKNTIGSRRNAKKIWGHDGRWGINTSGPR